MRTMAFVAALIAAGALTGCVSNSAGIQAEMTSSGETDVVAYELENDLVIRQLQGDYVNGLYRAQVVVENMNKQTQTIQYQMAWYGKGEDNFRLSESAWTPVTIYGKDQATIRAVASSPEVGGFRINIRDLKANKTFKTNFFGIR